MKKGWQTKTLGEVCEVMNGGTPKTGIPEYWDGSRLWITPAEMGKRLTPYVSDTERKITDLGLRNSSAQMLPPNSVILSSRAPIGHLVINTEPMATNQGCKGLIPGNQLQHKFLYFYLSSIVDLLNSLGTGATFKELSGGKLKEVTVPVPPLLEQRRIVGILDEAFDGLATATVNAEKNLQNARAFFESHVQAVFSEAWRDSEVVPLTELASDITDGDHLPPPKTSTGIPFITIGNIVKSSRKIDFSDTYKVSRDYFDSLKSNRRPQRGDVLYTVTGSFGIPVLIDDWQEFCFQRHIGLIRPKSRVDSRWLSYLMLSPQVFAQADAAATGAAQRTVSLKALRSFVVPSMSLIRQEKMAAQLDALAAETQRLESIYQRKLAALGELKKSLLHQAFTGQL
ncbi:MAG: restriction endonuclease subunit S [Nitrospira sp.]|nr:restriction endonuclease subunit S [Nitrospira sp.]